MSNQTTNHNLNSLIDPTFTNVNRTFVLSFENENDRTSSKYYVPKVEIKDVNGFIDGKPFSKKLKMLLQILMLYLKIVLHLQDVEHI